MTTAAAASAASNTSTTPASLVPHDFAGRLAEAVPPCISLFQATHRHHPDNLQDPIRFGNLLKSIEATVTSAVASKEAQALLEPLRALALDESFWSHTLGGVAVFRDRGRFEVFITQRGLPELAVVADTFHTKPLRRLQQTLDRYQLLALSRDGFHLYEGDRDVLDEIAIAPANAAAATETPGTGTTGATEHAHLKPDADDLDSVRFFRAIDQRVQEQHSKPSGLPLILAALPEHHAAFRAVSTNPLLSAESIAIDPGALSVDELRDRAWQLHAPAHAANLSTLAGDFAKAAAHGQASDDLQAVIMAAREGRVAVLLLESDRQVPGTVDADSGRFRPGELDDPSTDDVLDDVADLVETMGGRVVMMPADRMPSASGIAGTYRY